MTVQAVPRAPEGQAEKRGRRPRAVRVGVAAVALAAAAVLGAALSADRPVEAPGALRGVTEAAPRIEALLDANLRAVNDQDVEAFQATLSRDAQFTNLELARTIRGSENIALFYGQLEDMDLRVTSDVVNLGGLYAASYGDPDPAGVLLFNIEDGKIAELVLLPAEYPRG